jgi:hypothetical protein
MLRREEDEYIRNALYHGRSPGDLHKAIDRAVVGYVRELRGAATDARRYEAQRDLLRDAASIATGHLRQLGAYGGADEIVARLESALEHSRGATADER